MELFIRIKDGQPFEHPILGSNFREAFPDIDTNNLPPEFMRFERQGSPLGVFEMFDKLPYFIDGNVVKDGVRRPMTPEEKAEKIKFLEDFWVHTGGFPSWTLNTETGEFEPPVPIPDSSRKYRWNEDIKNWVETA